MSLQCHGIFKKGKYLFVFILALATMHLFTGSFTACFTTSSCSGEKATTTRVLGVHNTKTAGSSTLLMVQMIYRLTQDFGFTLWFRFLYFEFICTFERWSIQIVWYNDAQKKSWLTACYISVEVNTVCIWVFLSLCEN